jgi:hypothetical protein
MAMQAASTGSRRGSLVIAALLIAIIALALAGYTAYTSTTQSAKKSPLVLKYDVKVIHFKESNVSRPVGDTFALTGLIYPAGQVDKVAPIGNYTSVGAFTDKAGNDLAVSVFDIKGVGQIVQSGLGPATEDTVVTDAITGGTGQFAGAQGTVDGYYRGNIIYFTITITSTSTV